MRTVLELLRIVILLGLLGALGWLVIGNIYAINKPTESYSWLGAIAMFILLFVLYRNVFQFSGWYKGEGNKKLSKPVTVTLLVMSIVFLTLPFVLGFLSG